MEHITVSDTSSLKKVAGAKKKAKKAKETFEVKNNINVEKSLTNHKDMSNGLTNGDAEDHEKCENHLVINDANEHEKNINSDIIDNVSMQNDRLVCTIVADEVIEKSVEDVEDRSDRLVSDGVEMCNDLAVSLSKINMNSNAENDVKMQITSIPGECSECKESLCSTPGLIEFESYRSELQMAEIMRLIQKDLSEPYSIYTYRYFIHNWPKLCFLATHGGKCVGAIVCKLDLHRKKVRRGYIAMLAVDEKYRKRKIGSFLVKQAIMVMVYDGADEVVLETEITNKPALRLYENLGFVRDKRLFRYYLNGVDALRLKLWLR